MCTKARSIFNRRGRCAESSACVLAPVVRTRLIDFAFAGRAGRLPSSRRPGASLAVFSRQSGSSIGIPQKTRMVEPISSIEQPAVTVVEISDPAAANAGIELIDLDAVQLQATPFR